MNQKSKRNLIVVISIVIILIILLLRMCNSCNSSSPTTTNVYPKTDTSSTAILLKKDSGFATKDTIKKLLKQEKEIVLQKRKKIFIGYSKNKKDTAKLVAQHKKKDTTIPIQKDTLKTHFENNTMKDTLVEKEEKKQDTQTKEKQEAIDIISRKPKQDTQTNIEYVKLIKSFFSSVIIEFEGLEKNNKINNQLNAITHFRVFVKMATKQPLSDDFMKKIFVRISDSTTGKLIAFKGLSTMMQSITLYNMQEIDYTLAQQANFDNEDKSSTIEKIFERLSTFKPKINITVRTEVFCQGVKIGEKMTHLLVDKKAN